MQSASIPLPARSRTLYEILSALQMQFGSWRQARRKAAERRMLVARLIELRDRDPRLYAEANATGIELPPVAKRAVAVFPCVVISTYFTGGRD